ncbi:50S ribosomal protein L3 [Candidatus Aerophobetes bacterium Ae_b3a]|uniref:Large ribosomal subunit protein uL3 n=1 Tax=Aerophobetes bacterium TaxID=2030807 RepID=A0A523ZJ55_UNCAE|nr:MAG: 50S ribosomal protein L3 [Candidatus Aerophobetes bacterium]TKJ47796.1 MAG: 50S ribosomal protein L3 [Candidatus Aerophobetes bacterium Ae_b3a]
MSKVILGRKLAMTQIFDENVLIPITIVEAGPCIIVERKVKEKNGYNAIQLGFLEVKENRVNKPELGHFKKSEVRPQKYLREIRVKDIGNLKIRDEIRVDVFKEGDLVDVVGISKGKGFAGVVKRYGFKGGPASHGAGGWRRRPGSIGASADPSRVFKGKKMPGKMGAEKKTVRNLKIVKVDKKENLLLIRGSLPGIKGSLLTIKSSK